MKSLRVLLVALAAAALPAPAVRAQSALPDARPSADEVRAIRQLVEKQGHQIDELRQALDELTKIVQLKEGAAAPAPAPAAHGSPLAPPTFAQPPAATTTPVTSTAPAAAPAETAAAAAPAEPRVERAELAWTPHTVAKGETLTSIAKHYNITIAELHKANKTVDERKLQIGQVLHVPTQKAAENPTEKKETP